MDEKTAQSARLWEWCLQNLTPRTRWRFEGPTADDRAVILVVHNTRWDQPTGCFDIEFDTIHVIEPDGNERQAAPAKRTELPDWVVACQIGPTPLFMPSTAFKEHVDAGRIRNLESGHA